eukprot:TRINITY_DN10836_c0_g1_i1.p1 TRINITY_DN10836_c0_g1~~TRINITY_DN10836_c0_g1_i1.p1  ORF type:complete len:2037 (+),score=551.05 TRINITY_DN10836_c0_g1_i1:71-6112(+)
MASRGTKTTTRPSLGGAPARKLGADRSSGLKKVPAASALAAPGAGVARVKKTTIHAPDGAAKIRSSSGVGSTGVARWGTAVSRSSTSAQHHAALPASSRGARSISPGPGQFSPNLRVNGEAFGVRATRPAALAVADGARPTITSRPHQAPKPLPKESAKAKSEKTVTVVSTPMRGEEGQPPVRTMHAANAATSSSRSVTASPAAARRVADKPLRRSMSPAAVYRKQAVAYHRAETNTSHPTTSNVPPLKISRVERSLTMSSDDRGDVQEGGTRGVSVSHATPHANTARERGSKSKGSSPAHDREAVAHVVMGSNRSGASTNSPGVKGRDSSPLSGVRSLNSSRGVGEGRESTSKAPKSKTSGASRDSISKSARESARERELRERERELGISRLSDSHNSRTEARMASVARGGGDADKEKENTQVSTTLSSLVSLADSVSLVYDAAEVHGLATSSQGSRMAETHRRIRSEWLKDAPRASAPAADATCVEGDLRASPLLSLCDAVREGRGVAAQHRASGHLSGTGFRKLMRVGGRTAAKNAGLRAHDAVVRGFSDAEAGGSGREALCNKMFALAAETGGSPYAVLREAALFNLAKAAHRNTHDLPAPTRSAATVPAFRRVLQRLWSNGIPVQVAAHGDASRLTSTELLWALDDLYTPGHPVEALPAFAFFARSLADALGGLRASPALKGSIDRVPGGFLSLLDNHCADGVFLISTGAAIVLVSAASPPVAECAAAAGFTVCAVDAAADDGLKRTAGGARMLSPNQIVTNGSGEVYVAGEPAEKKLAVLTLLRAALAKGESGADAVALMSSRRLSVLLAHAYRELVVEDFHAEALPAVRREFAMIAPEAQPQEESRFCGVVEEKVRGVFARLRSCVTVGMRGLMNKELSRTFEDRVEKLHRPVCEDATDALRNDLFLARRHAGVVSGPFAAAAASLVESFDAGMPPNLAELALKAWDIAALELAEQVYAPMAFSDAAIDRLVRAAAAQVPQTLAPLLPDGDVGGQGGRSTPCFPPLEDFTAKVMVPQVLSADTLPTALLGRFLDDLRNEVDAVIAARCRRSPMDVADAPKVVLDVFVMCFFAIFALERRVLAPAGGRLRGSFYSGMIEPLTGRIADGFKAGEERRLQAMLEAEVAAPRAFLAAAFEAARSPVQNVAALIATVLAHAAQCGVARVLQANTPCATAAPVRSPAALASAIDRDFAAEMRECLTHLRAFSPAHATWETLRSHLGAHTTAAFDPSGVCGVVLGHLRRLGGKVPVNSSFIATLLDAVSDADAYRCHVAEYILRRASAASLERALTCGIGVGIAAHHGVGSVVHFGVPCVPAGAGVEPGAANAMIVLGAAATVLPDSELTLALVAAGLPGDMDFGAEDDSLEWPPRLRFALTVPAMASGKAMLRFDGHGATCVVTAAKNTSAPIGPGDVVAREESREGCVCLSLAEGSYTALVCNAGGRSKLRLIDDAGCTPPGGDVQHLPVIRSTTHTVPAMSVAIPCNRALGPLASAQWSLLPQIVLAVRGSGPRVLVLHGKDACFALFKDSGRVKNVTAASLPFAVAHAEATPFGDLAWTALPDVGDQQLVVVPYVPHAESKITVSYGEGTSVMISSIPAEMNAPNIVPCTWNPATRSDSMDMPQYALLVRASCCPVVSVYTSVEDGVAWYLHALDGEEMVHCSGAKGLASTSVHLSAGMYVLSVMTDPKAAVQVTYDVSVASGDVLLSLLGETSHVDRQEWRSAGVCTDAASPFLFKAPQYHLTLPEERDASVQVQVDLEYTVHHPHTHPVIVVLDRPSDLGPGRDVATRTRAVVAKCDRPALTSSSSSAPATPKRHSFSFDVPSGRSYTLIPALVHGTDSATGAQGVPVGPPGVAGAFSLFVHAKPGLAVAPVREWLEDRLDGVWDPAAGKAGGSGHRKFDNPQYVVSLRGAERAVIKLGAFNLGNVTLFVAQGSSRQANDEKLICMQSASDLRKDERLAEAVVNVGLSGDGYEQFVVTCATESQGTEGSFQLSVYSDSASAPAVRAI